MLRNDILDITKVFANADQDFITRMSKYTFQANDANVLVYKGDQLLLSINPFDNTQFIFSSKGFKVAKEFGAKRFLVGEARKQLSAAQKETFTVQNFSRDLNFPLVGHDVEMSYEWQTLVKAKNKFRTDKHQFYLTLSELFSRCANFLPSKQGEYLSGGAMADKYCRFKLSDRAPHQPTTLHTFLFEKNKLVGTISASIMENNGEFDIYFYDEIVDYFTQLTNEERETVYEKTAELAALPEADKRNDAEKALAARIEVELALLIEPKRKAMMAQLFTAARFNLQTTMPHINLAKAHAFIRAAADRVEQYVEMGCSRTNTDNLVIHGRPERIKELDVYLKNWATEKLQAMQVKISHIALMRHNMPIHNVDVALDAAKLKLGN